MQSILPRLLIKDKTKLYSHVLVIHVEYLHKRTRTKISMIVMQCPTLYTVCMKCGNKLLLTNVAYCCCLTMETAALL